MVCLRSKRGAVLVLGVLLVLIVVWALVEISRIYENVGRIMEKQNKQDAHMLSVVGLYVDTLDQVSWINKQLRRIAALVILMPIVPGLTPLISYTQKIAKGLEVYQDFLLLKLKIEAPILDRKLRFQNELSLLGNYHYLTYRRQPAINLLLIRIPGLIEFNKNIFRTACITHSGLITNTQSCIDSNDYRETRRSWFAPTKDTWTVGMDNAY